MQRPRPRHVPTLLAVAVFTTALPLHAATFTWRGNGTDNNFSTANNWLTAAPPNDGSADLAFANTPGRPFPNAAPAYSIAGLLFSGTTSYSLSGTLSIGADGIADTSTVSQALSASTTLIADQTWSNTAAEFDASGPLALGNHTLQVNANTTISFQAIAGTGGLSLGGPKNVFFLGNASYSGNTVVNGGSFVLNPGSSITASNITVNNASLIAQGGSIANSNGSLNLATTNSASSTANFSGSNISLGSLTVASGFLSTASITQFDQTATIGTLTIAGGSASTGSYTLANTGSLTASNVVVGGSGSGNLSLAFGNASITILTVGGAGGGHGAFTMAGGNLASLSIQVGNNGTGTFTQNGGNVTLGVGALSIPKGSYSLISGTLAASSVTVGDLASASFNQSGGSATFGSMSISSVSGTASVTVSGTATLLATTINVGTTSPGIMVQNGGNVTVNSTLTLGAAPAQAISSYTLNSGQLNVATLVVGNLVGATFTQNGGNVALLGTLQLGNGPASAIGDATYTLNGGTLTLPGILHSGSSNATLIFNGGTLVASTSNPGFIASNVAVQVQAGGATFDTAAFTDNFSAPITHAPSLGSSPDGGFTKLGNGTLNLMANVFLNGPTSVSAGPLVFSGPSSILNTVRGLGSLALGTNATLQATSIALPSVSLNSASTLTLIGGTSNITSLTLAGVTNAWTSTLALQFAKLIIQPAASAKATTLATLQNQVAFGISHNTGILDYFLPANTKLAVIDNAALAIPFTTFGGLPVDSNSLLIAPELLGDGNIDGHVDLSDLNTVLNNLGTTNSNWTAGNFDGAATIDLNDLNTVLNNLGTAFPNNTSVLTAETFLATAAPTPESSTLLLSAAAPLAFLAKRRRKFSKQPHRASARAS